MNLFLFLNILAYAHTSVTDLFCILACDEEQWLLEIPNLVSPIEVFSSLAGLSLLAQRLPVVPVMSHRSFSIDIAGPTQSDKMSSEAQDWMDLAEWVKVNYLYFMIFFLCFETCIK